MPLPKEARRKKVSDYAWFKLHWGDLFAETAGMTDKEFRQLFIDGYRSWRKNDIESMPTFIRHCAEETIESNNRKQHSVQEGTDDVVPVQEGTEMLSISLSSLSSSYCIRESEERVDPIDVELCKVGPPQWIGQEAAVLPALQRLNSTGKKYNRAEMIAGARGHAEKCRDEKTPAEYVGSIRNWIIGEKWYDTMNYEPAKPKKKRLVC